MTVLLTGDSGMIGSRLVSGLLAAGYRVVGIDRAEQRTAGERYRHIQADLSDAEGLRRIVEESGADRVIHLAALAHTDGEDDLSWERYYHVNVRCAQNVFDAAGERPVLFISTVDVFGFYDGKDPVTADTAIHPVTPYGRSKAMAEAECRNLKRYTIFRFSPVYTDTVKRDIQKRYYLKYPGLAYQIGKGAAYEILNVDLAVSRMVDWCGKEPKNTVEILKDPSPMWTPDYLRAERAAGRARFILRVPRWVVNLGYGLAKGLLGENGKTYLLNKAVHPLRSELIDEQ